jgi:hypothetical protein
VIGAGRFAAVQGAEWFEIGRTGPVRLEVGVEEQLMGHLVLSIVVDVLSHVLIELGECLGVGGVSAAAGNFVVLDAAEFVVLLPEIGFEDLGSGEEPQDGRITAGQIAVGVVILDFALGR